MRLDILGLRSRSKPSWRARPTTMRAILTPFGSRGDVDPFLVIGRELHRRGHDVTMLAAEPFAGDAQRVGIGFASIWSRGEYEHATTNPDLWHPTRGLGFILRTVAALQRQGYDVLGRAYEAGRTVLIGHTLSFFTRVFEEVHRAPAVTVHLAPNAFRSAFRQPVLPPQRDLSRLPRWGKRALWWGVDRLAIDPYIAPALNRWRAELGLPPVSRVFKSWLHSPQRTLGLFPDWFADPQPDWPPQLRLTGFVLRNEPESLDQHLDDDIERFVSDEAPPVVFTPGSANRQARPFFTAAIDAVGRINRRALFVSGFRDHLPASLPGHVRYVPYAPFARLFPRAAAVVHHGGIGTCAQAFAAGVPQLVMPIGFDQPDNAAHVARLGVGEVVPPAAFHGPRVASILQRLLGSARVAEACRGWRTRIDGPEAIARTCNAIEQQFDASAR